MQTSTSESFNGAAQRLIEGEALYALLEEAKNGCEAAFEEIYNSNQGFVFSLASQLEYCRGTMTYDELLGAGRLGLWRAVVKYKRELGEFPPYAWGRIYDAIRNDITKESRTVYVPGKVIMSTRKLSKFQSDFFMNQRREPTLQEYLAIMPENLRAGFEGLNEFEKTLHLEVLLTVGQRSLSLTVPIDDGENTTWQDRVEAPSLTEEESERERKLEILHHLMRGNLGEDFSSFGRSRQLVLTHLIQPALEGKRPMQYDEVAAIAGCRVSNIIQVRKTLMNKMKRDVARISDQYPMEMSFPNI